MIEKNIYKEIKKYEYLNNYISIKSFIPEKNKSIKFFITYNYNDYNIIKNDLNLLKEYLRKNYNKFLNVFYEIDIYNYDKKENYLKLEITII